MDNDHIAGAGKLMSDAPAAPTLGERALAVIDKHIDRARKAISECRAWSPAQAEWSRARDLALDIRDEVAALLDAQPEQGVGK